MNNEINNQNNNRMNELNSNNRMNGINNNMNIKSDELIQKNVVEDKEIPQPTSNNVATNNNIQYNNANSQINNSIANNNVGTNNMMYSGMNNNFNNQSVNSQPVSSYNLNNQKSNNKKFIALIIGIVVLAIVCISLIVIILTGKKDESSSLNKNINEYEENNENVSDNNIVDTDNETKETSTTYTYSGFEFQKNSGYQYGVEQNMLVMKNSNYVIMLDVVAQNFDTIKTNETAFNTEMKTQMEAYGYTVSKLGLETISGKEVYVGQLSSNSKNFSYFIIKANDNYIFTGMAVNSQNTFDQSNLVQALNVTNGAKYIKGYDSYSKSVSFAKDVDLSELQ